MAVYLPTPAQIDLYQWHREVCLDNKTGQSTFKHRAPQGTLTQNATPGSRNKRWTQGQAVVLTDDTTDYLVWCVWNPKPLQQGKADVVAVEGWMLRAQGQMPAIDDFGSLLPVQAKDWIVDPFGQLYRCENPVPTADGALWTFELWSTR